MTEVSNLNNHNHIYLKMPADSFLRTHPAKVRLYLKVTSISALSVISTISTTKIPDHYITITETTKPYYDKWYTGTQYPNEVTIPIQDVSFNYYFTGAPTARLAITYTYVNDCIGVVEDYIRHELSESKSHADIIEYLGNQKFFDEDVQNWIDAIEAAATTISSAGTTTIYWMINQAVTPRWTNNL